MKLPTLSFWAWFRGFAARLPVGEPPEAMLDELLEQLRSLDDRIYFELSTNTPKKELILTAMGDISVIPVIEELIAAAPVLESWSFEALKPARGFNFVHRDGGIELNVAELWFLPLKIASQPHALGIRLGVPDADTILDQQSVDTAYTILETGIGERSCACDVQYVEVADLPDDPAAHGYLELPRLAEYIAWHKRKRTAR